MRLKHPSESWSRYCNYFLNKVDHLVFDGENEGAVVVHEAPSHDKLTHIGQITTLNKKSRIVYTLNKKAIEKRGEKLLAEKNDFAAVCEEFLFGACYLVRMHVRTVSPELEKLNTEWLTLHMDEICDPLDPMDIFRKIERDRRATSRALTDWHIDGYVAGRIAAALYLNFPDDRHYVAQFLKHNILPKCE